MCKTLLRRNQMALAFKPDEFLEVLTHSKPDESEIIKRTKESQINRNRRGITVGTAMKDIFIMIVRTSVELSKYN